MIRAGRKAIDNEVVSKPIPSSVLRKHMVALGGSGSGKTFAMKALALSAGVPIISVDDQGDIASMVEEPGRKVVIISPGSDVGVRAYVDPIYDALQYSKGMSRDDKLRIVQMATSLVAEFLGLDQTDTKYGRPIIAAMNNLVMEGSAKYVGDLLGYNAYSSIPASKGAVAKKYREVCEALDGTSEENVFYDSAIVDWKYVMENKIDLVVYIANMPSSMKQFLVGSIASGLVNYVMRSPSEELQAIMMVPEVFPYLPPFPRNPPAKEALAQVFKQGRKFGLGFAADSQNPGDLDYKLLGNTSTWVVGRFTTEQDIGHVKKNLGKAVSDKLPSLSVGDMVVVSADVFPRPKVLRFSLGHNHRVLSPAEISEAMRSTREDKAWK